MEILILSKGRARYGNTYGKKKEDGALAKPDKTKGKIPK